MRSTSCGADAEFMESSLLLEPMLVEPLGRHLQELSLTAYTTMGNVDLDRLTSLSCLESLWIIANPVTEWHTRGELSKLTRLKSFTFDEGGYISGDLIPALGALPDLEQLTLAHVPSS